MSVPFIGRSRELDRLLAVLQRAQQDRAPAAALITGEAGSGKSRLLLEFLDRSLPVPSIRVAGFEPMRGIPLASVGELLRLLSRVPGHGARLEALVFGQDDPAQRDPVRIFEAAHRALSSHGPLLAFDITRVVDAARAVFPGGSAGVRILREIEIVALAPAPTGRST